MSFLRRTTTATERVALTFDPAIIRENAPEVLEAYPESGEGLTIPPDALTITIRPLSLDQRFQVEDIVDPIVAQAAELGDVDQAARVFIGLRITRRRDLAVCRLGVVKAEEAGETVDGADALLAAIPQMYIDRAARQIAGHILRLSSCPGPFA